MPSRRPPSQREPAYALHRLVGTVGQILPGSKVKNASPVPKVGLARVAAPPVAAGGALGFCVVTMTGWPSLLSDAAYYIPTTLTLSGEHGDHGIVVDNATVNLQYGEGLFVIAGFIDIAPSTNSVSSDMHSYEYSDWANWHRYMQFGTQSAPTMFSTLLRQDTASGGVNTPGIAARCSGGTNRHYSVLNAGLQITRFASP